MIKIAFLDFWNFVISTGSILNYRVTFKLMKLNQLISLHEVKHINIALHVELKKKTWTCHYL